MVDLTKISTEELLEAANLRKEELRKKYGKYATNRKLAPCPKCKNKSRLYGVRELRRHMAEKHSG